MKEEVLLCIMGYVKRETKMKQLLSVFSHCGVFFLLLFFGVSIRPAVAVIEEELPPNPVFALSLEELLSLDVVTASIKSEPIKDAPVTVDVITARQILERGYESLEDALRDLPGIDLVDVQGIFPVIWAPRGAYGDENKRTLLMIDGIVENNILEGNVLGGPQYSLHNVKRIEFIWAPVSSLYGANAYSGVINIITKKGRDVEGFELQRGAGSFATNYEKFIGGGTHGEVDFSISGSRFNSHGPVFEERHPNYSASYVDDAYSVVTRVSYKETTLGFSRFDRPMGDGQFSNSAAQYFGLPLYGYEKSEGQAIADSISPIDMNNEPPSLWHPITNTAFLKSSYSPHADLTLHGNVFYKKTEVHDDSCEYALDPANNRFIRLPFTHTSDRIGVELYGDYLINLNQDFIVGAEWEESDVERGYRETAPSSGNSARWEYSADRVSDIYTNTAVFGQYRWRTELLNSTAFTLGLRYDYNNKYGSTTNPRVGLVIKPNSKWVMKGSLGTAYRAPNSFDLYTETTVRVANPDLVPEKITSYQASLCYEFCEHMQVQASFYHNQLKDMIVSNVDIGDIDNDGEPETQNQNQGKARITGMELRANYLLSQSLSGFASLSLQRARQEMVGEKNDVPNVAEVKGNIGLTWYLCDCATIYAVGRYVGDRSTSPTNPRQEVAGYFVTDLTITSGKFFYDHLRVSVKVNNIFDIDMADPGIRSANGLYYPTQHTYPGRSAFFEASLIF